MELNPINNVPKLQIEDTSTNPPVAKDNLPVANNSFEATHSKSDVDRSPQSQHHTLGFRRNQSSPGDHTHDGQTSRKLGTGEGLVLTGAKGGNVALTNLIALLQNFIDFTDSTT